MAVGDRRRTLTHHGLRGAWTGASGGSSAASADTPPCPASDGRMELLAPLAVQRTSSGRWVCGREPQQRAGRRDTMTEGSLTPAQDTGVTGTPPAHAVEDAIADRGTTNIGDAVVEQVAGTAAAQVDGVLSVGAGIGRAIAGAASRSPTSTDTPGLRSPAKPTSASRACRSRSVNATRPSTSTSSW